MTDGDSTRGCECSADRVKLRVLWSRVRWTSAGPTVGNRGNAGDRRAVMRNVRARGVEQRRYVELMCKRRGSRCERLAQPATRWIGGRAGIGNAAFVRCAGRRVEHDASVSRRLDPARVNVCLRNNALPRRREHQTDRECGPQPNRPERSTATRSRSRRSVLSFPSHRAHLCATKASGY